MMICQKFAAVTPPEFSDAASFEPNKVLTADEGPREKYPACALVREASLLEDM